MVHVSGTRMIDAGIYRLYRGNYLGGITKFIERLKFIPLYTWGIWKVQMRWKVVSGPGRDLGLKI